MPSELGKLIRNEREKRKFGLREFAAMVGKSPAFMVRIETDDELPAVLEETLVEIASKLALDLNVVLALAKKMPRDLVPETALELALYRKVKGLSATEKKQVLQDLQKKNPS